MSIQYSEDHTWLQRNDDGLTAEMGIEVNEALRADPSLANSDPLGAGWFFKVKLTQLSDLDALHDEASYQKFTD